MRHGDKQRKFNMPKSQRRALFANLTNALLTHEQITTTLPRAKELRSFADGMITFAKKGDLNSRRLAAAFLRDDEVVAKLFSTLGPRYKDRNGGYTRVLKSGFRYGDCAPMAIIELVDRDTSAKGSKDLARVKAEKEALAAQEAAANAPVEEAPKTSTAEKKASAKAKKEAAPKASTTEKKATKTTKTTKSKKAEA
ncbi:MAG TPA: 50S ribosomal protein L17 [Alphaproteobacteria bacterium]|nr:50S ribosomal protein L17 [Alphaproteobacteria bacterium]